MDSKSPDNSPTEPKKPSFFDRLKSGFSQSEEPSIDVSDTSVVHESLEPKEKPKAPEPIVEKTGTVEQPASRPAAKVSFMQRMRKALARTGEGIGSLFLGGKTIDDELLEELETLLLMADVGIEATGNILAEITDRLNRKDLKDSAALKEALNEILSAKLQLCEVPLDLSGPQKPYVILVVGVNGVGKTTTIGKIASRLQQEGKSVMLAAGDTFRAAAVEQLQVWGERNNVPVVAQHTGADSASVIFDAVQAAKSRGVDVIIADTAGRLHNKSNLMEELKKVVRVAGKLDDSAPHEVLLVLDAGTGQNAVSQMAEFNQVVGVTGIALTKLDGTAKGGVIFALADKFSKPIRYIGVGEAQEDLQPFVAKDFVDALLDSGMSE